ncbi:MAG: hypothetical protein ISQ06_10585 [Planctomycetaceae bacterium]|nr:hypothetical protein [Planctomycetaceae bacterium]
MRVAIVSRCESRSLFIIRQVVKRWPDHLVVRPVRAPSTTSESRSERIRRRVRKLTRHPIQTVANRLEGAAHAFYHWYEGDIDQQITQLLFDSTEPPEFDMNCVDVPWREINSEVTERRIREFSPDVLLVCVAPILRPNIFTIPPHGTINVHHGLVPFYRGEHTLFWPLYYREYDQVGVTVHYVDEGVDTGKVLACGCPEIRQEDNEASVTARSTRLAVRLTCDVLAAAQWGPLPGLQQSREDGREFRHRQRTGWKELWYLLQRDVIGHRPFPLIERSESHFARSDDEPNSDIELEQAILSQVHEMRREIESCRPSGHVGDSLSPDASTDSSSASEAHG